MKRSFLLLLGLSCGLPCLARTGLPGITSPIDDPPCAYACTGSLSSFPLECSVEDHSGGGGHHHHGPPMYTSPECRANDTAYLTTLAWCLRTKCAQYEVTTSRLEAIWEETVTGDVSVPAKWSYTEALLNIADPPTGQLVMGDTINATSLAPASWDIVFNTAVVMSHESTTESTHGLVLLLAGFAVPIVLTLLGYLPFMGKFQDKIRPYLVYPALIAKYNVRPLPFLLGNAPTVGQALAIASFTILNVLVTAVNYHSSESHLWLRNQWQQTVGFLMYRTGVLSYAMLPLVVLFAGRNNLLLWLTNWPHSTYMLLHRWVARLFLVQALLHSVLAVILYKDMGIYDVQEKLDYWAWGVVATVLGCVTLFVSTLYVRQRWYEIFLLAHIFIAIIIIVGCWYHVVLRFPPNGSGFETWLYMAIAVWAFDRVARLARIVKTGVHRARVEEIGDGYVRVDVEGVRWGTSPGRHVYVHFPTLNKLRPWESHPFSVLPTSLFHRQQQQPTTSPLAPRGSSSDSSDGVVAQRQESNDIEKDTKTTAAATTATPSTATPFPAHRFDKTTAGLTLFIRKSRVGGMTQSLLPTGHTAGLLTLLDGPYPNNKTAEVLGCDRVLLVAGGIGITGVLPWVDSHPSVKLAWGLKESARCLVAAMEGVLGRIAEEDKEVRVGARLDVDGLLAREIRAGWARIGVVACGPGGLCDDVRAAVVAAGRKHKTVFVLEVDAYSW